MKRLNRTAELLKATKIILAAAEVDAYEALSAGGGLSKLTNEQLLIIQLQIQQQLEENLGMGEEKY